jgi:ligand-binding SRPBCC domain-containing protein
VPEDIYGGLLIEYSMKAVAGIAMTWLSEISHCDKPRRFVYTQRAGPFKFWSHEVCLTAIAGRTVLEDIVFYAMPLGWFGLILNKLLIANKLTMIFETRRKVLATRWGTSNPEHKPTMP